MFQLLVQLPMLLLMLTENVAENLQVQYQEKEHKHVQLKLLLILTLMLQVVYKDII